MRSLSDGECLTLWELGLPRHELDRALLMLRTAYPEESYDSLADWSLGRRNRALAALHISCFGSVLNGWADCPRCAEALEFQLDAGSLIAEPPSADAAITVDGRNYRVPSTRDLAAIADARDPAAASLQLLRRCVLDTSEPAGWSVAEIEEIGSRMAEADPLSETRLAFRCAACDHQWGENFDIASFLWAEIEARARHVIADVHVLASAYGWSESQILALGETRRGRYLALVQG
jgi:hypothetical protein